MNLNTILIVDDDDLSRELLHELLMAHFNVISVSNADCALQAIKDHKPQLALLDLHMPKIDGIELCKKIRSLKDYSSALPIIMISGEGYNETLRTKAFLTGVDDFVAKPISSQELIARVMSKLSWKRNRITDKSSEVLSLENLSVNMKCMKVSIDQQNVELTNIEYSLLKFFVEHPNEVMSRAKLLKEVWCSSHVSNRTVDTHVYSLRQKIDKFEYELSTVHGIGYILKKKNIEITSIAN